MNERVTVPAAVHAAHAQLANQLLLALQLAGLQVNITRIEQNTADAAALRATAAAPGHVLCLDIIVTDARISVRAERLTAATVPRQQHVPTPPHVEIRTEYGACTALVAVLDDDGVRTRYTPADMIRAMLHAMGVPANTRIGQALHFLDQSRR